MKYAKKGGIIMNLAKEFIQIANSYGNRPAISFKDQDISYVELANQIKATINILKEDVKFGDIICCFSENRPEIISLYLATTALGAIFVPINHQLTPDEVADILKRTNPVHCFTSENSEDLFKEALKITAFEKEYKLIGNLVASNINDSYGVAELQEFDQDTDALIIFTSGSTGVPKGVVATHLNELESTKQYKEVWHINENDKVLITLPMSFLYGLTTGTLTCLFAGAHVVLEEKFHPVKVLNKMVQEKITLFMGVPTMYNMMLNASEKMDITRLDSIRLMLTAGAPIAESTVKHFKQKLNIQIMNFFALTEVRPVIAYNTKTDIFKEGSCGRVAPGVQIKIQDNDGNEVVSPQTEGELLIKSNTLFKCYYNDPDQTKSVIKDGWFYTGDLVKYDEEGYFYIVGRKKELIIRGGINISPSEIEECISKHPSIYEVAVIGIPDDVFGEKVAAVISLKEEHTLSPDEIQMFVKERMAEFKVPEHIVIVSELPKSGVGKINKKELKKLLNNECRVIF